MCTASLKRTYKAQVTRGTKNAAAVNTIRWIQSIKWIRPCHAARRVKSRICCVKSIVMSRNYKQTNMRPTKAGARLGPGKKYKIYKYVHLRGLTYIHPHMPILRPHAARSCVRKLKGNRYERHESGGALADSTNFGLLREQPSQKWEFPCLGRRCTAVQNLTPLSWSSAE